VLAPIAASLPAHRRGADEQSRVGGLGWWLNQAAPWQAVHGLKSSGQARISVRDSGTTVHCGPSTAFIF
jgi:hypothetical protein